MVEDVPIILGDRFHARQFMRGRAGGHLVLLDPAGVCLAAHRQLALGAGELVSRGDDVGHAAFSPLRTRYAQSIVQQPVADSERH